MVSNNTRIHYNGTFCTMTCFCTLYNYTCFVELGSYNISFRLPQKVFFSGDIIMQIETKLVILFKPLIGLLYWIQLILIKVGLNGARHCLMLWKYVSPKVVLPQRRNQPTVNHADYSSHAKEKYVLSGVHN